MTATDDQPEDPILAQVNRVNLELVELVGEARMDGARDGLALARALIDKHIHMPGIDGEAEKALRSLSDELAITSHQIHNQRLDESEGE